MTALYLLPGLDGTGRMLAGFAEAAREVCAGDVRVVAYPRDRVLDYVQLEAFARAALPATAPLVLLGESFSGPVALSIAADPPRNLVGLVLSTTFARAPVPALAPLAALARFAPVHATPAMALSMLLLGRWGTPALLHELQASLRTVAPAVLRARAVAATRVDVSACLPRIAVPTLSLVARQDRLLRRRSTRQLVDAIDGAIQDDFDGPHLLLQTRTDACTAEIAAFLARIASGCPTPA